MNKKNKGFTLIEVLATIAIIAVVTLLATVTYTKVRSRLINKQYRNLKAVIEIAGVRYTSKTGETEYYVQELIDEGYLDPDDETGNIYDPRDNHSLNCHLVRVDIDNSNYYAELGDISFAEKDGCHTQFKGDPELTLTAYIHGKDKNYLTTSDEFNKLLEKDSQDIYKNIDVVISKGLRWTNKQLDLTANINPNTAYYHDLRGIKYVWNNDASSISENNKHTTSVQVLYTNPYTVEAITKDNQHLNAYVNYYFDRKPPEIKKGSVGYVNNDKDVWKKSKWIYFNITAEDDVGVDRIYAGKEPCSELKRNKKLGVRVSDVDSHKHVQTYEVKIEAGKDGENGEINICAIDKLGNIVSDDKTETFKIMKIDITKPHCTKELKAKRSNDVIGEHNKYQYASRTIRQYCYDNNMINGVLVVGSQCDPSETGGDTDGNYVYFQKTFGQNGAAIKTGYITIYDKVGWSTKCTVDAYVDRKGPLCSKKTGNTQTEKNNGTSTTVGVGSIDNWDQLYRHITQYCYDEHIGCLHETEEDTWTNHDSRYTDPRVIRTATITISDKVPYCSRKETVTSSNCSGNDWNSSYNNTHYNNKTSCTEGVYIDSIPPKASRVNDAYAFHHRNRVKVECDDPKSNAGIAGSGVKLFTAAAKSNTTIIKPCHNPSDCSASYGESTEYGKEINNNVSTGDSLQFYADVQSIHNNSADITVHTTCEDKAGNKDSDRDFVFTNSIDDSLGNNYIGVTINGCQLREFRAKTARECENLSYDCSVQDQVCNSNTNSGAKSTCCYQGTDAGYGCKDAQNSLTDFNGDYKPFDNYLSISDVHFMQFGDGLYLPPAIPTNPNDVDEYDLYCRVRNDIVECKKGRLCTTYNCYLDHPGVSAQEVRRYICGNKTRGGE